VTSGVGLLAEDLRGFLRHEGVPMRSRFDHGREGVGCGQEAGGWGQCDGGGVAVIPAPVQPLMMSTSNAAERGEKRSPIKNPFSVVGVKPDLLPLVGSQRSGFLPDTRVDGYSPNIVNERRPSHPSGVGSTEAAQLGSADRQSRHARRVAGQRR
jgi:hypothetical protein